MSGRMPVGVIGSGSFGLAVANLLAINQEVVICTRQESKRDEINQTHRLHGLDVNTNIRATTSLKALCEDCRLIFPIVPSEHFRALMRKASPYLRPLHLVIHGTKGLDIHEEIESKHAYHLIQKRHIHRMSEVIQAETNVLRVGCLSGPNLAKEINAGLPTATLVASDYDEVIEVGQQALNSDKFFVFGSHDLVGAEYAGTLKNIIALGSGLLSGKQMGRNMQAMMITRALHEVIYLGQELGSTSRAFLGTAGIGDIIATSFSSTSRNFQVGYQFAKGASLDEILSSMEEVAEGLRTLQIAHFLSKNYKIHTPIIDTIYRVFYQNMDLSRAIEWLMKYPYAQDVDFL